MAINKSKETSLVLALGLGASPEQAARQTGVSESTVYRRLRDPEFRRKISDVRDDMVQRASGMLTASAMESVKTLLSLQGANQPPAVRLGAARAILEIGIRIREVADLSDRVAELEQRLGQPPLKVIDA